LREAHKQAVEEGYDRVAEHYLATKDADDPITPAELENLTRGLPSGAAVLDLGCGAGGAFLATWALGAWEGEEEGWGAPMRWSHYDGETSLALLREAGFATLRAEARTTRGARGDETWLWVLAQKGG
jgi:SAM-dependent methyltransferase